MYFPTAFFLSGLPSLDRFRLGQETKSPRPTRYEDLYPRCPKFGKNRPGWPLAPPDDALWQNWPRSAESKSLFNPANINILRRVSVGESEFWDYSRYSSP